MIPWGSVRTAGSDRLMVRISTITNIHSSLRSFFFPPRNNEIKRYLWPFNSQFRLFFSCSCQINCKFLSVAITFYFWLNETSFHSSVSAGRTYGNSTCFLVDLHLYYSSDPTAIQCVSPSPLKHHITTHLNRSISTGLRWHRFHPDGLVSTDSSGHWIVFDMMNGLARSQRWSV